MTRPPAGPTGRLSRGFDPLQRSPVVPRCPVLPASGRSRYGVSDPSRHRTRRTRRRRNGAGKSPTGTVAARAFRPCGFPPAPAPHGPTSLRRRRAAPHSRAPARSGHAPPVSSPGGVPLPVRAIARPGRGPHAVAPAALLGFDPSRCCSRPRVSGRLRPSDPPAVSPAPRPVRGVCCESDRPAHRPLTHNRLRARRPRALAAAPGLRPRGWSVPNFVRNGEVRATPGHTALGFSSLRSSDAGVGVRFRPLPLVGFADVPDVMRPAKCSARRLPRGNAGRSGRDSFERPPATSLARRPFSDACRRLALPADEFSSGRRGSLSEVSHRLENVASPTPPDGSIWVMRPTPERRPLASEVLSRFEPLRDTT
jgi:hypothetical protein